ncbi:hypothetical protein KIPB_015245, partial [Kipferlia bialata]|eukprot:g15245.t1
MVKKKGKAKKGKAKKGKATKKAVSTRAPFQYESPIDDE